MEHSLEDEIEQIREAMLTAADKSGLSADETLEISRQLDRLINKLEILKDSRKI